MKPIFLVVIEGGLVQDVLGVSLPADISVVVVDYDVEGTAEGELFAIPQSDGTTSQALVTITNLAEPHPALADHLVALAQPWPEPGSASRIGCSEYPALG